MKRKSMASLILALALLLTVAAGSGTAFAANTSPAGQETSDVDAQLSLIASQIKKLKQAEGLSTWFYSVTDLDHNGNLEFIAASQQPDTQATTVLLWEVSADRKTLTPCSVQGGESEAGFPDLITDTADSFYDAVSDTWAYLVYNNAVVSTKEFDRLKCSVTLKDGVLSSEAYAAEHTALLDSYNRSVSHTDLNGVAISQEQYNAAGLDAFAGWARSNTAFSWLTAGDVEDLANLTASYAVFSSVQEPEEVYPAPISTDTVIPAAPAVQPVPSSQSGWLMITKNPTNETVRPGARADFIANANAFESLVWTFVSPDGGAYTPQSFIAGSASTYAGENSTTLSVYNVESWMNGWGAYCTFYYQGQTVRSSTAYIIIDNSQAPVTPSDPIRGRGGVCTGTVTDWTYSTVSLNLGVDGNVTVPRSIVTLIGELYYGAPATAYWSGYSGGNRNFTYCQVQGYEAPVQPVYGSMSGTLFESTGGTVLVALQNGSSMTLSRSLVNIVNGTQIDGCSCTVYYTDYPSESTIYAIDVYGWTPAHPDADVPTGWIPAHPDP